MSWVESGGLCLAFSVITSLYYKRGVKAGITHALKTLNLEQYQVEKLNKELKKDSHDLAMKIIKSRS